MLPGVGYLVTLLALARFFAPDPNATPTEVAPAAVESKASEAEGLLRPVVFLPGALPLNTAPRDLRNPFDQAQRKASMVKTSERRAKSADLRDPFADTPRKQRRLDAAPDLRDPFEPARPRPETLPRCPETGGVPIQRPEGATPGCKQASRRRTVLARR